MFFAKAIILLIVIFQIQEHLHMIHLLNAHSSSVDLTCWKMIMVSARAGPVKRDQFQLVINLYEVEQKNAPYLHFLLCLEEFICLKTNLRLLLRVTKVLYMLSWALVHSKHSKWKKSARKSPPFNLIWLFCVGLWIIYVYENEYWKISNGL